MAHEESALPAIGERLRAIRADLGETQKMMSSRLGLGPNTWQRLEAGSNVPSGETLLAISALGYDPTWVLTGVGAMRLGARQQQPSESAFPIDSALMAKATEAVGKLHREMGFRLTDARLGALVFELLTDIGVAADGAEEYEAQLEIMLGRMRRKLKAAIDEPGTGKRLA